MAYSFVTYTSAGGQTYNVPFPYLDADHVKVLINGVETTAFTWSDAATIHLNAAPAVGATILIKRETPRDGMDKSFSAQPRLKGGDLDEALLQAYYIGLEALDNASHDVLQAYVDDAAAAQVAAELAETNAKAARDLAIGAKDAAILARGAAEAAADLAATYTGSAGAGTYMEVPVAPTTEANEVKLYAKDVTGASELFIRKESDGAEVQVTSGSGLNYRKNLIINGDMRIAQRGTPLAGFTTSGYSLDMWQLLYGGGSATLTISRETAVPSGAEFSNSLKILVTTADNSVAAGDNCCIVTKIEGYDARKFYAKTATLSFWVSSPKTGVHSVAFRNGTQNVSYCADYTVNQANTWEYKTITLTINGPGTWDDTTGCGIIISWALMVGSNYTQAPGSWVSANKLMSSNQSANILDTVNNAFYLTGVQFEIGSVATPFEFRHYGTELTLCQRYYEVGISAPHLCGAYTASYIIVNRIRFAVLKRTAPTVVTTTVAFLGNMGTGQALHSAGAYVDSLAPIYSTTAATAGAVGNVTLSWTATAEL